MHKCEANYNDVVMEHQQLQDKHALEAETAQEQLQKLHTSSQENERQLNSGWSSGRGFGVLIGLPEGICVRI